MGLSTTLQVDRLHSEKACLQKEKTELQRTVTELGSSIDKMHRDKVALESQMEMEEEGIVNRLNRSPDSSAQVQEAKASMLYLSVATYICVYACLALTHCVLPPVIVFSVIGSCHQLADNGESCRQLDAVMSNMQALEGKLEAKGINVKELGPLPYDYPSEYVRICHLLAILPCPQYSMLRACLKPAACLLCSACGRE